MTQEERQKSIETGEVQLTGLWLKSTHYGLTLYLLIVPFTLLGYHLWDLLQGSPKPIIDGEWGFIIIPIILSAIFYFIQKNRLKFKIVLTGLSQDELKTIIKEVAKELKWIGFFHKNNTYTATTNPGFFSGSWGEQITVIFVEGRVLVNSICDPKAHASVVSMGRNRKNENTLIDRIEI